MHPKPGIEVSATRFTFSDELLLNDLELNMGCLKGKAESVLKLLPEKGNISGYMKYNSPPPQNNIIGCEGVMGFSPLFSFPK